MVQLKVVSIIILLNIYTGAYAQESSEKIKKVLAIQQASLATLVNNIFAVGSLQISFLTEEQFQKEMGAGWILCDGRSTNNGRPIAETRWGQLTGRSNIPDCRGQFFRTVGGMSAPLGQNQGHKTSANGLKLSGASSTGDVGEHGHGISGGNHGHGMDSNGNHTHQNQIDNGNGGNGLPLARISGKSSTSANPTDASGNHAHTIHSADHSHAIAGSGAHSHTLSLSIAGFDETRPDNISVNAFIRVN